MKKYYLLLLFVSSFVNAQIGIVNPTPLFQCETIPNSNEALFFLNFKNYEIFGELNLNNYTIEYYSDVNMMFPISISYQSPNTTIYIKVIDNSNPTIFQTTSLDLIVKTKPQISISVTQPSCISESNIFFEGLPSGTWFLRINGSSSLPSYNTPTHFISNIAPGDYTFEIGSSDFCFSDLFSVTIIAPVGVPAVNSAPELHNYENPFDGSMIFDLTLQESAIMGDQTGVDLIYYTSNSDALNDTNPISNPTEYQNLSNPQTIWVRAVNTSTNCYHITDFKIKVFDSNTIVNTPDLVLKSRLLSANSQNEIAYLEIGANSFYGPIDLNSDGEIQKSEALYVTRLNLNSRNSNLQKITSLAGIESFLNVSDLNCSTNLLTELNITPLINNNLFNLDCSHNNLTTFDFNSLGSNIGYLNCSGNNLSTLNISNLVNLIDLSCDANQLTTLDISPFHLAQLSCSNNQISTLNFTYPQELTSLNVSNNLLTSLDLTSFSANLSSLICYNNNISSLDFSNINPWTIWCGPVSNPIQIQNCTNLQNLRLSDTQQGAINFTNLINLTQVTFLNTNIEEIDLSNATYLNNFTVYNAEDLTYINLKTGKTWYGAIGNFYSYPIKISSCPNLLFICADETNVTKLNEVLTYNSIENVQINSYCSFTPGGNFNTITGSMLFDENNNGCDASDLPQPNIKININDGTNQGATFTSNSGNYSFFTQAGSFDITPSLENPSWFNFSPTTATIPFADNNDNLITQNFCLSANGIHPDVEVVIVPIIPARPGFDAVYKIVYKNKGNQTVEGSISLTFNDAVLDFVTSSVVPTLISGSTYNWNVGSLAPFQAGNVLVTFNVNSPQEIPAVNIDDVLTFNANINLTTDVLPNDNSFEFNQTVVGSYDPNDITCLQGNTLPTSEIGDYLHYNIRFENTGTAPAENIVVKNTIDLTQYDIQSLQIMESSHPMTVRVTGNIAEFIFEAIDLDTGGHGNILLKLKSNATIPENEVTNNAGIYFDYNFPVATNDEETVFADLSKNNFTKDPSIQVYPNPASSVITVKSANTINSIELYDVQGRLLSTTLLNERVKTVDLSNYSTGVYFVNVTTVVGKETYRVLKK